MRDYNVAYFTASNDPVEKNKSFAESVGADYPILSDPDSSVAKKVRRLEYRRNGRPAVDVLH